MEPSKIGMIIDSSNQRPYSWIIWNQKNLLINKINTAEIDRELVLNTHDWFFPQGICHWGFCEVIRGNMLEIADCEMFEIPEVFGDLKWRQKTSGSPSLLLDLEAAITSDDTLEMSCQWWSPTKNHVQGLDLNGSRWPSELVHGTREIFVCELLRLGNIIVPSQRIGSYNILCLSGLDLSQV